MKLGLCVLGCGNFARTYAQSIQPILSDVDLYFASRDLAKAKSYTQQYNGIASFGSYEEAVNNVNVDAIYICTPHNLHVEHCILAAAAKKHILVEKPISTNLLAGQQIIESAAQNNIKLMVAENYRFMPAVRLCKKLVDEGTIGNVRLIQVQQESPYQPSNWRAQMEMNGGGVFIDAGIHKVHFLRYIIGDPNSIFATSLPRSHPLLQGEDGLILVARWSSGEVGLIQHSWTPVGTKSIHWAAISGDLGRIYFEIRKGQMQIELGSTINTIEIPEPLNGLLPMTEHFIRCITENRAPEVTGEEGIADLSLIIKAYESIREGMNIPV